MKHATPILALFLGTCAIARADGKLTSEARTVPAFRALDLAGTLEVEVSLGKPASVQITGEPDLVAKVTTVVKDGTLVIDTRDIKRHKRDHNHLRAIVTAPDLGSLGLSGTGSLAVTGISNDNLVLSVPGTGSLTATGTTGTLRVTIEGTGEIAAHNLASKTASVEVGGTGQIKLRASDSLDATITGTGAIEVHGRPAKVRKSVTGTGAISFRN